MDNNIRRGRFARDDALDPIAASLLASLMADPDSDWAMSGGWLVMSVHDEDGDRLEYVVAKVAKTIDA